MKKTMSSKSLASVRKAFRAFFKTTPHVILGTGTSCAVDAGFGMAALKDALFSKINLKSLDNESQQQWKEVAEALKNGTDFEHSLDYAKTNRLQELILQETGRSVAMLDQQYAASICKQEIEWPAMAIVKHMFDGLSCSDHNALNVITTNYDLLFEYSCAAHNFPCIDGFCGNVIKKEDWHSALQSVSTKSKIVRNRRKNVKNEYNRHIRLHKVHGSLNRFLINNEVVEVDMWIDRAPDDAERVIITPGSSKYEKIQKYRKELQAKADESVEKANGFLFLGYGMNDTHIQQYIVKKIQKDWKPAIIVTRDFNERIERFAQENDGVWVVCGLENPDDGTRIFNKTLGGWLSIPTERLWDFSQFAKSMM